MPIPLIIVLEAVNLERMADVLEGIVHPIRLRIVVLLSLSEPLRWSSISRPGARQVRAAGRCAA